MYGGPGGNSADISLTPLAPSAYTSTQDAQEGVVEAPPILEPTTDTYTDGTISVLRGQY